MRVIDVLNTVTKENLPHLADLLAVKYPKYYSDKDHTIESLEYFYAEVNSTELDNLQGTEYEDFLVLVSEVYDDNVWYGENIFDIAERQRLAGSTEYGINVTEDGLDRYFDVDAVHTEAFKDVEIITDYKGYLEAAAKDSARYCVDAYAVDFIPRSIILACEVADLSVRKYSALCCAAELFWELTFYGLTADQVKEEADKLDEARKDIDEGRVTEFKTWNDLLDDEDSEDCCKGGGDGIVRSDMSFATEFSKDVNKFCHKLIYEFYKELQASLKQ